MSALHRNIISLYNAVKQYPLFSLYLAACGFVPLLLVVHFINLFTVKGNDISLAHTVIGLLGIAVLLGAAAFQKILMALAPPTVMLCTFCPMLTITNDHTPFNDAVVYPVLALFIVAVAARIFAKLITAAARWMFPGGIAQTLVSLSLVEDTHASRRS